MSELTTQTIMRADMRWQLLATVSALALATTVAAAQAKSEIEDRPTVWIELGAQLERVATDQSPFAPPFAIKTPTPEPFKVASPLAAQRPARYAIGGEGKLIFTPEDTNWVFSAAIRYGRANSSRNIQHQSAFVSDFPNPKYAIDPVAYPTKTIPITAARFSYNKTRNRQSYSVVDFQAGKDVGLGMFGSSSVISAGVRYAAFSSRSDARITARPTAHVTRIEFNPSYFPGVYLPQTQRAEYTLTGHATRNFHGIGPALGWTASAPFLGTAEDGEIAFDWGINGAVLFGRQKASGTYQVSKTIVTQPPLGSPVSTVQYAPGPVHFDRSRSVIVPNLGGFAGLSVRYADAKVSFGYRADYFFGAMDTGIDSRKTSARGFFGPFAKISIGLGN